MEAGLGARARTGVILVCTKSYSCPALTPQRSPVSLASAGATAVPLFTARTSKPCRENFAISSLGSKLRVPEIPVPSIPLETRFS